MTVRLFLPEEERTRRGAGWVFVALALAFLGGFVWLIGFPPRINVTSAILLAPPSALLAVGLWFAFRRRVVIAVDADRRTYAVIRNGARSGSGPLDSLGPLVVQRRTRLAGSGDNKRTVVEYVVHAAEHSRIDLYVTDTPTEARRRMQRLARSWRVSCKSYGGTVLAPEELGLPLHRRLAADPEARTEASLNPEWGLRIERIAPGYAFISTRRSWAPLLGWVLAAAALVAVLVLGIPGRLLSALRGTQGDLLERVLAGLLGFVLLALLWKLGWSVREALSPGTLRVTDAGVSYRRSRMAFEEIEEVAATFPVELVGHRRTMRLAPTFCPPAAATAVAHEIQRMILELATPR
jgi:hypothetical protein